MISDFERAVRRISKHPHIFDDVTGCKLAKTCVQSNGYIKIKFKGKYVYLHRLVAFVHLGLSLDDTKTLVLHKRECPNRHCFSKNHLYLGNLSQNANDYVILGKHHERPRLCIQELELINVLHSGMRFQMHIRIIHNLTIILMVIHL